MSTRLHLKSHAMRIQSVCFQPIISHDGPPRMGKRPTGSGGEPSSPNCETSAEVRFVTFRWKSSLLTRGCLPRKANFDVLCHLGVSLLSNPDKSFALWQASRAYIKEQASTTSAYSFRQTLEQGLGVALSARVWKLQIDLKLSCEELLNEHDCWRCFP